MKNLSAKFAVVLCFCVMAWGCEDETLTQVSDPTVTADAVQERSKPKNTKDSKFLKKLKVSGVLEDGRAFKGKVTITEFGYSETEGLWVSGFVKGKAVEKGEEFDDDDFDSDAVGTEGMRTNDDDDDDDDEGTVVFQSFSQVPATLNENPSTNARMASAQATQATCDVLFLNLGPLSLDLLGLTVDLSEITLDINAVSGAGNLLGNLLCAVAGLLDPAGFLIDLINTLETLLDLLNQINDLIG